MPKARRRDGFSERNNIKTENRHAGNIGELASTFEEAKFMLVACHAFVYYLIAIDAD